MIEWLALHLVLAALTAGAAATALVTAYLLFLTLAAFCGRRVPPQCGDQSHRRFAILVPAHDEAAVIGRLLECLQTLDYPADRYRTYVVADNCTDGTAALARTRGACVYERFDTVDRGKGFALRWLLAVLRESGQQYDAYVVLDADSVVDRDFLRCMDARLQAGSIVVQAYYAVLNAADSPVAGLRQVALAAYHYLRPLGRAALRLSCGLKGNGMCFAAPVIERFSWQWFTLAEDVEFHLALVRAGIRVDFAPEARVLAEMPVSFAQAASQNARWERGRLDLLRQRVFPLLLDAIRQRSLLCLDAAIEQCIPPLSVPVLLAGLCLVGCGACAALGLPVALPAALAAFSLVGQAVYLLAGLSLVGAPWDVYRSLLHAPAYVIWKFALYARAAVASGSSPWIRTTRVGGTTTSQHSINARGPLPFGEL